MANKNRSELDEGASTEPGAGSDRMLDATLERILDVLIVKGGHKT